jgi:hypothetical protein
MRNVIFFFSVISFFCAPFDTLAAGTLVDFELSASRDDNVNRAESSDDIKSDNIIGLGINLQRAMLLTPSSGILLRGKVSFDQYLQYEGLSHITLNAGMNYRFQPVVGYSTPVFDIGTTLERSSYTDSDIRDGTALQADASMSSRVTDRIKLRGGLGLERRWADQGDVFAWQRWRVFAGGDYRYSAKTTLYASVSRDDGDQVFTTSPNLQLFNESKAAASDPVFGTQKAYRFDATAYVLDIGDSVSFSANTTLDIGLRYFSIDAYGDHSYDGAEIRASWLYRFK